MAHEHMEQMSQAHYEALQKELAYLVGTRRQEVADQLAEARSYGDLSENAEYDEARNEQARLETEIAELEYTLAHAQIIQNVSVDEVGNGSIVTLKREAFGNAPEKIERLKIVSRSESDYALGKISDESPIGKAAMKKRVGDRFMVEAPAGMLTFTVLEISEGEIG